MAYCSIDDIKAEFKTLTLATDTKDGITEAEITAFIEQATAQIDAQVSNCWELPIEDIPDNKTTLLNLKNACVWLVADRLVPIIQVKSRNQNLDQTGQDKITYYMKAKSLLNMLCPIKTTGVSSPSKKDSSSSVDSSDNEDPTFQINTEQW